MKFLYFVLGGVLVFFVISMGALGFVVSNPNFFNEKITEATANESPEVEVSPEPEIKEPVNQPAPTGAGGRTRNAVPSPRSTQKVQNPNRRNNAPVKPSQSVAPVTPSSPTSIEPTPTGNPDTDNTVKPPVQNG